jgi:hypothetical protein
MRFHPGIRAIPRSLATGASHSLRAKASEVTHLSHLKGSPHEPDGKENGPLTPALSPWEGEREKPRPSVLQVGFMVPMRDFKIVVAPQEASRARRASTTLTSRIGTMSLPVFPRRRSRFCPFSRPTARRWGTIIGSWGASTILKSRIGTMNGKDQGLAGARPSGSWKVVGSGPKARQAVLIFPDRPSVMLCVAPASV